jgi:hypothetical protein
LESVETGGTKNMKVKPKTQVIVTHDYPNTTEITGYIHGREVMIVNNHIGGKWKVGMSVGLPTDPIEAQVLLEVYQQVFDTLDSLK